MARAECNLVAQGLLSRRLFAQTDYYSDTTPRWYLVVCASLLSLQGSGLLQRYDAEVVFGILCKSLVIAGLRRLAVSFSGGRLAGRPMKVLVANFLVINDLQSCKRLCADAYFQCGTCRSLTPLIVPPSQEVQLLAGPLHLRGSHEMFMSAAVSSESSCTLFLAEVS